MRGLVTYLTSLHRGAGLSLIAGIINRGAPEGLPHLADAGLTRTTQVHQLEAQTTDLIEFMEFF